MTQPSLTELPNSQKLLLSVWTAGFFDGEGHVSLSGSSNITLRVGITQKSKDVLLLIQEAWGGHIFDIGAAYQLVFTKYEHVVPFLDDIEPYLKVKGDAVRIAREFLLLRGTKDDVKRCVLAARLRVVNKY